MDYCGPIGLPLTEFLEWSDLDRGAALAWHMRRLKAEADRCGSCGQPRSEWTDENGVELRRPTFEVVEVQCPACAALERYESANESSEHRPGTHRAFHRIPAR